MEDNELKVSFSSTLFSKKEGEKKESDKKKKDEFLDKIKQHVCALLNSQGGKLILTTDDNGVVKPDDIIRPVEQSFQKVIDTDHLSKNMYICQQNTSCNQITYAVKEYPLLCTLNYNIYLPTDTQVLLISPLDIKTVTTILDVNRFEVSSTEIHVPTFVRRRSIGIKESSTVQFKQLKAQTSKSNNLASRILNNKFAHYVSAFANNRGGRLYYGIEDDGTVCGEIVTEKDHDDVTKKINKSLKNMRWPEHISEPRQGEQWDIMFVQVIEQEGNATPSTFVIIVSIAVCVGGVFCKDPESYHIVNGEVKEMEFSEWKLKILYPKGETRVARSLSRCDWSSNKVKTVCDVLDGDLLRLINNGDEFREAVDERMSKPMDTEVRLVLLSKWYVFHYRQGRYDEAAKCLVKFKEEVPKVKDTLIFETRGQLIESALERTRGDHKRGYVLAKEFLAKVDQISPCMLTVEFYVHFATMLTIIEGNKQLKEDDELKKALVKGSFKDEAIVFYNRALEHLRETDYVPQSKMDMEQKTRINLAILKLGCSLSGDVVDDLVKKGDIEEASTNLERVTSSIIGKGCNPLSDFRTCHFKFAESSLFYRRSQHETEPKKRTHLLKSALRVVKIVTFLAEGNKFQELFKYAEKHALVYKEELTQLRQQDE